MGPSLYAVPGRCLLRGGPATSPLLPGQHRGAHVCPPHPVLAGGTGHGPGGAASTRTASLASKQRVLRCPPTRWDRLAKVSRTPFMARQH